MHQADASGTFTKARSSPPISVLFKINKTKVTIVRIQPDRPTIASSKM